MVRTVLTGAAELVGLGAVSLGCWLIWPPVGLIAAGIGLIALGVMNA